MGIDELEKIIVSNQDISMEFLYNLTSKESLLDLNRIHTFFSDIRKTAYILLTSYFYTNQTEALSLLTKNIVKKERPYGKEEEFYKSSKEAYKKRCKNNIPHDIFILKNELTNSEPFDGIIHGKVDPGPIPEPDYFRRRNRYWNS